MKVFLDWCHLIHCLVDMCRALLKDAQKVTKQSEPVTESFQQTTHDKNVKGSISWVDSRKRMAGLVNLIKLK